METRLTSRILMDDSLIVIVHPTVYIHNTIWILLSKNCDHWDWIQALPLILLQISNLHHEV